MHESSFHGTVQVLVTPGRVSRNLFLATFRGKPTANAEG